MRLMVLICLLCFSSVWAAPLRVVDDNQQTITLAKPAQRIISLAPHVTELVFAAGGGPLLVGAVEYSDYPEAAKKIPRVGDNRSLDLERIAALKPDLIIVWQHGNPERQLQKLRDLGIPIFYSEPQTLNDVATSIERLGLLMGKTAIAQTAAQQLRQRVARLQSQYAHRPKVSVFYQVWDKPLMTLNGKHIISSVIRLCGGENPFAALPALAPTIDLEAVLAANPEVIFSTSNTQTLPPELLAWKKYPSLSAIQRNNLFVLNADLMSRNSPRLVDGAEAMCKALETARQKRK